MVTQAERQVRTHSWEKNFEVPEELVTKAGRILHRNDMGGWTHAAPWLYPHQWSWDSAFIAVGLAHLDTRRAAQELRTLFAHQWKTGKVPHIVFNSKAPPHSYYPDADHWACAAASPDAPPAPPYTRLEPVRTAPRLGLFGGFVERTPIPLGRDDVTRELSFPPHPLQHIGQRLAAEGVLPARKLADGNVRLLLAGARLAEGYAAYLHLCLMEAGALRLTSYLALSRLPRRLAQRRSPSENS
jgi:Mannosylglycerate hydrolase MGH1-like glycoside hydrolase domain